jgi:hypothetical protein
VETSVSTFFLRSRLSSSSLSLFENSPASAGRQPPKLRRVRRTPDAARNRKAIPQDGECQIGKRRKIYLKSVAYFLAASERLFFLHVYHAFHHVYTSKKPPLRRQFSKIPLKNARKSAKPQLNRGFIFFSAKRNFPTQLYRGFCLYMPSAARKMPVS